MTARTPQDDLAFIQSFASDDPRIPQAKRFRAWFGWRPSTAARCPRTVAGKRCYAHQRYEKCICQRLYYPLLDHPRMWLTREGERVFTAEPYHFEGADFADLAAECQQLGLRIYVNGLSPYFPGRSLLIVILRERSTADPDAA
jgi:hypothetical protein